MSFVILRQICCGRDVGYQAFRNWDEADTFRQEWIDQADGHERSGIITSS